MFAGMKKKPKKILVNTGEDAFAPADEHEPPADEAPAEEGDDLDFSNLKKKKKKRVIESEVAAFDAKLEEAGLVDEDKDIEVEGEDPFSQADGEEPSIEEEKKEEEAWLKSDRDYTYEEVPPHPHPLLKPKSTNYYYFSFSIVYFVFS